MPPVIHDTVTARLAKMGAGHMRRTPRRPDAVARGGRGGRVTAITIVANAAPLDELKALLKPGGKGTVSLSMTLEDALDPNILLCYEMNGQPLPPSHGFPLRLIAPGWYGIANVKWLTRIEVRDTRLMNRFMARDYVTIRAEQRDGAAVWTETSVGRALLKSVPAKVAVTG